MLLTSLSVVPPIFIFHLHECFISKLTRTKSRIIQINPDDSTQFFKLTTHKHKLIFSTKSSTIAVSNCWNFERNFCFSRNFYLYGNFRLSAEISSSLCENFFALKENFKSFCCLRTRENLGYSSISGSNPQISLM